MAKMRILVLTPTFLPALGGAELVILQIYRRLAANHKIFVLTPYLSEKVLKASYSAEYDNLINFEVQRYHDRYTFMKIRGHRISFGLIPPFSLSAVKAIKHACAAFRPDVINVHYVMPTGMAGVYAQKILKIPTVLTYNGRDVPGPGVPCFWKYWHRLVGKNCEDMTFVSNYCRKAIYGPTSDTGHVIYNGVELSKKADNEKVKTLRQKLDIGEHEKVIFALQRLDYLKRVDVIIKSMKKVVKNYPDTRLVIGGKGEDEQRLKNLAKKIHIDHKIIFAGFISDSDLPLFFNMADMFVFHSTYETFGMVLAEAMNYGKAIVSVKNTAITEVVEDGKTGLLVDAQDLDSMANALLSLLKDPILRRKLALNGKKKAKTEFLWERIATQYESVLINSHENFQR
jgi:phosphatidylinositol alpha-1,6-mannosyltransferase